MNTFSKADVPQNRCPWKFHIILQHWETPTHYFPVRLVNIAKFLKERLFEQLLLYFFKVIKQAFHYLVMTS